MEIDLIIGLIIIVSVLLLQIVLIIYNNYIVEEIHKNKLENIKQIKKRFFA